MTVTHASAISISPSQNWLGSDGPWSTLSLLAGTPPQNFDVLLSTSSPETLLPLPQACTTADLPSCPQLRGGTFLSNTSSTYVSKGIFALTLEQNLGYAGNGQYGFDTVALGFQGAGGPSLTGQVVGGYATRDFWLGTFGVLPRPSNFSTFNDQHPSFLQNLKTDGQVPSLSYGFTAGAGYRLNKVLSSLTLGGYDTSRTTSPNKTFPMSPTDSRDLSLNLQSLITTFLTNTSSSTNTNTTVSLLPTPIYALIDSTIPHLWLPLEACQRFESAFGLTWDESRALYFVNATLHAALKAMNPTFTLQLSITPDLSHAAGGSLNITLPYAAFDLEAKFPLVASRDAGAETRYFPLKRAANDSQYTLGRAFLQEAYLTADYERSEFTLSQAAFPAPGVPQRLVTILPPSATNGGKHHALSTGAIVGAVIGVLAFLALLVVAGLVCLRKRRKLNKADLRPGGESELRDDYLRVPVGKPELEGRGVVGGGKEGVDGPAPMPTPPAAAAELGGRERVVGELDGSGRRRVLSELGGEGVRERYELEGEGARGR